MFYGKRVAALIGLSLIAQPLSAKVTSNFGMRKDPFHGAAKMHSGMDMAAPVGTPVYATGDGIVRRARVAGGYGNLVELEHGYGHQSRFGHLSKILVREGQFVRRGDMIGLVGSTGRSTGPHLHYEVRINEKAVDPNRYMQIVFRSQPDWRAVHASMFGGAPAPRAAGTIAMARVLPEKKITGDLEIDFGGKAPSSGSAAGSTHRSRSGFSAGHSSYKD